MPFLTRAQIVVLLHQRRILDQARSDLADLCRRFSGPHLHSQACIVGGMHAGGWNGVGAQTPCPCGAEDPAEPTLEEARLQLGMGSTCDPRPDLTFSSVAGLASRPAAHLLREDEAAALVDAQAEEAAGRWPQRLDLEHTKTGSAWKDEVVAVKRVKRTWPAVRPAPKTEAAELEAERAAGAKLPPITGSFGPGSIASLTAYPNCADCEYDQGSCPHEATCVRGDRRPAGF